MASGRELGFRRTATAGIRAGILIPRGMVVDGVADMYETAAGRIDVVMRRVVCIWPRDSHRDRIEQW